MTDLKITLIRGTTHRLSNQRKVVEAPDLGRINSSVVLPDNAAIRGALMKIVHLTSIEGVNK